MPPKRRDHPTSESDIAPKPSKRARFAAGPAPVEDEDASRFEAEVDAGLNEDLGGKRGKRVKVDGYDSDSTDDGEGVVYSRRKEDDEDDDMFAAGDDDAARAKAKTGGKKETKYLAMGEIEGQEFDAAEGGDNDGDSETSGEPEDEDDAIRKSKEGMGFTLSKFNMKEEMEEGKFVEDGSFVRSVDAHAVHDKWLDDIGEREMKKARKAKRNAEKREKERIKEEERSGITTASEGKTRMEMELVRHLQPGESVLEALARLGREKKKKEKKASKAEKSNEDAKAKVSEIDRITSLASALMVNDTEVYSTTFEALVRSIRRSGTVAADWNPPVAAYEYRWGEGYGAPETKDVVYGPFSLLEMQTWYDASFFGQVGEKILVRKVMDGQSDEWAQWDQVFV